MSLLNVQGDNTPSPFDLAVQNYVSNAVDIPDAVAVSVDTANDIATGLNEGIGVIVAATTGDVVIGVTKGIIYSGKVGLITALGPIRQMKADGAITAGTYVDASGAS